MDHSLLTSICNQVYRKFPETQGKAPKITTREDGSVLLVFNARVTTADGKSLPRTVRVVADEKGKIIKMTTSR
jgi:hypothetical protein